MRWPQLLAYIKSRYVNPNYAFHDRLYFLFGTAGRLSAEAAFLAAVLSELSRIAAAASLVSFFIMLVLMVASFFMEDISANRVVCARFLNFFQVSHPVLGHRRHRLRHSLFYSGPVCQCSDPVGQATPRRCWRPLYSSTRPAWTWASTTPSWPIPSAIPRAGPTSPPVSSSWSSSSRPRSSSCPGNTSRSTKRCWSAPPS